MPLHSLQRLSPTAVLGLWHLAETPAELWPSLPQAEAYRALLPATAGPARQGQWLAGRVLTHELLKEVTPQPPVGLVVQNDATGRPWLAGGNPNLTLSLSHSGEWVAAVLAQGGRAGVDVEMVRDKAQRLASKFLNETDLLDNQLFTESTSDAANLHYTRLWSAKESLYKLAAQRGVTFKTQLLLGAFDPQESGEIPATLLLNGTETRHCICYSQPAPGYVLTYCHEPIL